MITVAVTAVVLIYLGLRGILPLRVSVPCKLALFALAGLILSKTIIGHFLYNSWTPEFPLPIHATWSLLQCALLALALLGAITDVFRLLRRLLRRKAPAAARPGLPPVLLLISLLLAALGTHAALRVPPVTPVEIVVPGLPAAWDGLTVAQLSDVHASKTFPGNWLAGVVDAVNAARPDLIVITGDLFDGTPRQRFDDLRPLRRLRAPLGVYACPGNHEYYSGLTAWRPRFSSLGILLLENDHVLLRRNGAELILAGLSDDVAERFDLPRPDIRQALGSAEASLPLILMAHRPHLVEQLKQLSRPGAALQLSGHTHGGQVFGLDLLVRRVNKGYLRGLYELGPVRLYISTGTALWSGFPLRLGVPSEIPLITLRSPHARQQSQD
ncbi:MAG TPA: metallophosphoesterase [Candidatus Desulfovibrio intestinigallinarum]|nr:metallophosphoesterase [Candidatus Desulfovibrio intestinigallinarum]